LNVAKVFVIPETINFRERGAAQTVILPSENRLKPTKKGKVKTMRDSIKLMLFVIGKFENSVL